MAIKMVSVVCPCVIQPKRVACSFITIPWWTATRNTYFTGGQGITRNKQLRI